VAGCTSRDGWRDATEGGPEPTELSPVACRDATIGDGGGAAGMKGEAGGGSVAARDGASTGGGASARSASAPKVATNMSLTVAMSASW